MALPTTLSGAELYEAGYQYPGPFKSSGGAFYAILRDSTNTYQAKCYKATDPTDSWTEQDSANRPVNGDNASASSLWVFQKGDKLHVAMERQTPAATNTWVTYARFDMSTDAWDEVDTGDRDIVVDSGFDPDVQGKCSIAVEETGSDIVIAYSGAIVKDMGDERHSVHYAKSTDDGVTWSAGNIIADFDVQAGEWTGPVVVRGTSDRMHFFFSDSSPSRDAYQRTLNSADSLETFPSAFDTDVFTVSGIFCNGFLDGSTVVCGYIDANQTVSIVSFTSADAPTIGSPTTGVSDNTVKSLSLGHTLPFTLALNGTDYHLLYGDDTDQDLYRDENTGSGWGTDVEVLDAVTIEKIRANVYDRSGTKLAYIYDDGGTIKYNEVDLGGAGAFTLSAESGSFVWTGAAAGLEYNSALDAAAGSYAWTGAAAAFAVTMPAAAAGYSWAGAAAGLVHDGRIAAAGASYAWAGDVAAFTVAMPADAASYTWTGAATGLVHDARLAADGASYAWSGAAAGLVHDARLVGEAATYIWAGDAAAFAVTMPVAAAGYSWAGAAAGLVHDATLGAESAAYTWTGSDVDFSISFRLGVDAGGYAWIGAAVGLDHAAELTAEGGAYTWTGRDAALEVAIRLAAEAGSYAWVGDAVGLARNARLAGEGAIYAWTGTAASLRRAYLLASAAATYAWSGQDADLAHDSILAAESAAYTWTGASAALRRAALIAADAASYLCSGGAADLSRAARLLASGGIYAWTGNDADLIFIPALSDPGTVLPAVSGGSVSAACESGSVAPEAAAGSMAPGRAAGSVTPGADGGSIASES